MGAVVATTGVNFRVWAPHASEVFVTGKAPFVALINAHVLAALYHQFVRKDDKTERFGGFWCQRNRLNLLRREALVLRTSGSVMSSTRRLGSSKD